ncbi:MAG: hypothetical protein JWQ62_1345 [Lacunisphaera sp.]|nr:hypothetical protein [Lacunisphaera sp.]
MKPETKYGLLIGAGFCLWNLADFALGFHTRRFDLGEYADYCSAIVPCMLLTFLLLQRRRESGGITLGQGVRSGAQASLLGGVILYLFMLVYNRFINPGWMDAALDWKVAQMRAQDVTEFAIRDHIDWYRKLDSPLGCFLSLVAGSVVLGALYSFLFTLVLRRKRPV